MAFIYVVIVVVKIIIYLDIKLKSRKYTYDKTFYFICYPKSGENIALLPTIEDFDMKWAITFEVVILRHFLKLKLNLILNIW